MDLKETLPPHACLGHWYYQSKLSCLVRSLDWHRTSSCLDYGCGHGVFSRLLHSAFPHLQIQAYDPHGAHAQDGPVCFTNRVEDLRPCETVLLMDVIEHCPDPVAVLRQASEFLLPGGRLFVTVPAFPALWSGHDEFLGHYRRYTLASLEAEALAAGCEVLRGHYLFAHLLPPAWVMRKLRPKTVRSDLQPAGAVLNALLCWMGRLDSAWAPRNRLGGLTVTAVLQRRQPR
jgi:2-polyprenyl-3-methyl-5-hydroxy-6-metoxy-1,4-benzoquinol methylase